MQLKNVGKSFGNQAILEDIQLNISPRKFTAFSWTKWCWKINATFYYEPFAQERSGVSQYQGKRN